MALRKDLRRFCQTALVALLALLQAGWALSAAAQPSATELLSAVVKLRAEIPPDARTARFLGTVREGNAVVLDDSGLALTIGYLILEAMSATLFDADGRPVPADIIAYDYDTGFGLVRATKPLGVKPMPLGDSDALDEQQPVLVAGHGGVDGTIGAVVVSRRQFAGYWEYLLDDAIFAAPPHSNWGGAALISLTGKLVGIGSLFVQDALAGPEPVPGNMFVPINLLKPIFADLLANGRAGGPERPWLGMFTTEHRGLVVITNVAPGGPADQAGLRSCEVVLAVGEQVVDSMARLFRLIWRTGEAGVSIALKIGRDGTTAAITVQSANRYDYLRMQPTY